MSKCQPKADPDRPKGTESECMRSVLIVAWQTRLLLDWLGPGSWVMGLPAPCWMLPQLKISIKVHSNQEAARRATGQWAAHSRGANSGGKDTEESGCQNDCLTCITLHPGRNHHSAILCVCKTAKFSFPPKRNLANKQNKQQPKRSPKWYSS